MPLAKARAMSAIGSGSSANTHHVLPPPSIWMVSPSLALGDATSTNDDGFVEDGCIGVPCSPFLQWAHCNTSSTSGPAVLTPGNPLGSCIIPTGRHESFARTLSSHMHIREDFRLSSVWNRKFWFQFFQFGFGSNQTYQSLAEIEKTQF